VRDVTEQVKGAQKTDANACGRSYSTPSRQKLPGVSSERLGTASWSLDAASTRRAQSETRVRSKSSSRQESWAVKSMPAQMPLANSVALAQRRVRDHFAAERRRRGLQIKSKLRQLWGKREESEESSEDDEGQPASGQWSRLLQESPGPADSASESRSGRTDHAQRRQRIAIVGGGPVGLWMATLALLRHARRDGKRFHRGRRAPDVVVFEQRPQEQHCSRRSVCIQLDARTVQLLQKHTRSESFSSGMALGEIEAILLEQWLRLGGTGALKYNAHIDNPLDLYEHGDWDLIFWAGGRRSLNEDRRRELGCEVQTGECDKVLVFEMRSFTSSSLGRPILLKDIEQLSSSDLTSCFKGAVRQVYLRVAPDPSVKKSSSSAKPLAWLWLLGVPQELKASRSEMANRPNGAPMRSTTHTSLSSAMEAEFQMYSQSVGDAAGGAEEPSWMSSVRNGIMELQRKVFDPSEVSLRWVDAGYWSSDTAVCRLPGRTLGRSTPLVLIGDAAMGKPFYTGTTLNVHLAEVKALSKLPVIKWPADCLELGGEKAVFNALRPYEMRYQEVLRRMPGFQRHHVATKAAAPARVVNRT